jgi:hypothetical protein
MAGGRSLLRNLLELPHPATAALPAQSDVRDDAYGRPVPARVTLPANENPTLGAEIDRDQSAVPTAISHKQTVNHSVSQRMYSSFVVPVHIEFLFRAPSATGPAK